MGIPLGKAKLGFGLDDRVTFGKNAGSTWRYVAEKTPDYILWCVGNTDHVFNYDCIVFAIKKKYELKKANEVPKEDLDYAANAIKNLRKDMWDQGWGDLDDDIPF